MPINPDFVPPPPPPPKPKPKPPEQHHRPRPKAGDRTKLEHDAAALAGGLGKSGLGLGGKTAPRTQAEANKDARELLGGSHEGRTVDESDPNYDDSPRVVERDATDVNSSDLDVEARGQIHRNAALEKKARNGMSKDDQARYDRLAKATEQDPTARLSLQMLVINGKLPGAGTDTHGGNLLGNLDRLATQPLASGVDRAQFLSDTIQELQTPEAIAQHGKGTCTVTSLQIKMATENPAEYARLLGGLASPEGKAQLANGDTVSRESDWANTDDGGRSTSSRLWQPAMMEYANGGDDYSNTKDESKNDRFLLPDDHYGGLNPDAVHRVAEGLNGEGVDSREGNDDDLINHLNEITAGGTSVPVGLDDWNHEVLVTKVDADRVYFNNPWGEQDSMSRSDFQARLESAHFASFREVGQA